MMGKKKESTSATAKISEVWAYTACSNNGKMTNVASVEWGQNQ